MKVYPSIIILSMYCYTYMFYKLFTITGIGMSIIFFILWGLLYYAVISVIVCIELAVFLVYKKDSHTNAPSTHSCIPFDIGIPASEPEALYWF